MADQATAAAEAAHHAAGGIGLTSVVVLLAAAGAIARTPGYAGLVAEDVTEAALSSAA